MSCPICSKPTLAAYKPFCSRRCADIDLSRWLKGAYAIPGATAGEDGDGQVGAPPEDDENPAESGR